MDPCTDVGAYLSAFGQGLIKLTLALLLTATGAFYHCPTLSAASKAFEHHISTISLMVV